MANRRVSGRTDPARRRGHTVDPDTVLFGLYAAFLAVTPFWYGGNSVGAWGFNAAVAGVLTGAHSCVAIYSGRRPVSVRMLWPEFLLLLFVCAWCWVQMSTWVSDAWKSPVWELASEHLGRPSGGTVSFDPDASALAFLRLVTSVAVFWLGLQFCREYRRSTALLKILSAAGTGYAMYGIYMLLFERGLLFPYEPKTAYLDSVTATFINRDSFATYAGLTLVAALTVTLAEFRDVTSTENRRIRAARILEAAAGAGGAFGLIACIIFVAVLLSLSTAGTIISIAGMISVAILSSRSPGSGMRTATVIIVLGLLGVALTICSGVFLRRMGEAGEDWTSRLALYKLTWASIVNAPWLGFGYGTLAQVFPLFRDASVPSLTLDKAQDSYLGVAQGLGLPAGAALIVLCASLAWRCLRGTSERTRYPAATIVALAGTMLVGLHALVDFSLQIQAVCLTWAGMLGAGVAQSWRYERDTSGFQAGRAISRIFSGMLAVFALAVMGYGFAVLG